MSLHIHKFVDLIKATESRGQRDIHMSLRDAKDLHADITKLLLQVNAMHELLQQKNAVIEVELTGGSFKNT